MVSARVGLALVNSSVAAQAENLVTRCPRRRESTMPWKRSFSLRCATFFRLVVQFCFMATEFGSYGLIRARLRPERCARSLDQLVVPGAGTAQVKDACGQEALAPRRRDLLVIFQSRRAELVIVRVGAL